MMIDTIKKFVKYGVFEATTDNYDYEIVDGDKDTFYRYRLTDNTITYSGVKIDCYSGSRFFLENGEFICKSDVICYDVNAEYYVEAMEKLNTQHNKKLERMDKLIMAKVVLKAFDGKVYNKKINVALARHRIRMEFDAYSIRIYYASMYGSSSEYLFYGGGTSLLHGVLKIPKGGKREKFYYTEELEDALTDAYNTAFEESLEIAKILDTPENYFKSCAKMNKLYEDYTQQISTLRNSISTDWDVMNILDNTVIDFKFK